MLRVTLETVLASPGSPDFAAAVPSGWVVYYRGPRIVVTSHYIQNSDGRYPVRDLTLVNQVQVFKHPARTVALICAAIELALVMPLAAAYGSAAMLCAGFITATGMAVALLVDGRRNPQWMALCARYGGQVITLFTSRNRREFEQVRRAVIRAVEVNRRPQP